jgi:pimeloyl-ACP methyl ester carboxylesterase
MRLHRFAFQALQAVAPERAAALAEWLFFSPAQTRLPADCTGVLEQASPFSVTVEGRRVMGWSWGRGPIVYLVHGWGSRGGRLAGFVAPLVSAGYQVVTYDSPGHGASDPGMASMPEFARALRTVEEAVGPAHGVIGHSMGASAAALAMSQGLHVSRAVFLSPAANPAGFVRPFADQLGLSQEVVRLVRARSERRIRFKWDGLDVPNLASDLRVPLLVFHDRGDRVVPWTNGAAIVDAWPDAKLVSTSGLGHRGVTTDPAVIAGAVGFITEGGTRQAGAESSWSADAIERELFYREERTQMVGRF